MDVFDLDRQLLRDYAHFARSFTQIRADDIRAKVDRFYAEGRFWPDPLITLNPSFMRGPRIDQLVDDGSLHPETGKVFCIDGTPLTLHSHQGQAVAKAKAVQILRRLRIHSL